MALTSLQQNLIYEFRLVNEALNITIWDFLLALFRIKERGLYFDQFRFFCEGAPSQYEKINDLPKTGQDKLCSGLIT